VIELENNKQIKKIAFLVSCASILQIAESLLPHPIPGIRLGLANMITLVALINIGFKAAVEITIFRTVISSFILGTFLSPTFILSFSGGLASTLVMGFIYRLIVQNQKYFISIIGISLLGSLTHNLVQIGLVYFLLIRHRGIFLLLPWLGISSVIMGWITGLVAAQVCVRLKNSSPKKNQPVSQTQPVSSFIPANYIHRNSPIHSLLPEIKIGIVFILALTVIITNKLSIYTFLLILLITTAFTARISFVVLLSRLQKLSIFILFSFFMPLFLNTHGKILIHLGSLKITQSGFDMGITFVFRIILLLLSASILILTTSPEELTAGLSRLLRPFRIFGFSEQRISKILMLSWTSLPGLWEKIRSLIQNQKSDKKNIKTLIPVLSDIITILYQETNNES
jgi:heptaprenyl diphosphate synthase